MVKAKRKIASLIAMAVMMVAALSMAVTGAYFNANDSKTGSETVNFGKVAVSVKGTGTDGAIAIADDTTTATLDGSKWVAGSTKTGSITISNTSTVDTYVMIYVDASKSQAAGATSGTDADLTASITLPTMTGYTAHTTFTTAATKTASVSSGLTFYKVSLTNNTAVSNLTASISISLASTNEDWNGKDDVSVTLTIKIAAIQAQNITDGAAYDALLTKLSLVQA